MEALIIYGYKLTEEEVVSLPADVPETWVEKGWLIGSDNSNNWYFAQDVINTDEQLDLEIMPENFFSRSTHEEFEQFNKRRQEFYKFFSSKQPKFFLILRETDNYYLDSYFMNEIRDAGADKILGI